MLPTYEFVYAFHPGPFTEFPLRAPNRAELVVSSFQDRRKWCHHWRLYRYRAAMVAEFYRRKREVFFSAALHDPHAARVLGRLKQPSAEVPEIAPAAGTVIAVPALWVSLVPARDAAWRDALPALMEAMPLEPSCAVSTATGFDFYWLLRAPWLTESALEQAAASAMLRGWHEAVRRRTQWRGFTVLEQDLGQILRFPESFDLSGEKPRPVVVEAMGDARYERCDFEPLLPRLCGPLALPPGRRAGGEVVSATEAAQRDLVRGLHGLLRGLGGRATSARILAQLAAADDDAHQDLRVALYELFPKLEPGELPSTRGLANKLRSLRGAPHDDLTIVQWPRNEKGASWSVERRERTTQNR